MDCSSKKFKKLMKAYDYYTPIDTVQSNNTYLLYTNRQNYYLTHRYGHSQYNNIAGGKSANYIELCPSKKHAQIYGSVGNLYPKNVWLKLQKELQPFYDGHNSKNEKRYVINDDNMGCYVIEIGITFKMQIVYYQINVRHLDKKTDLEPLPKYYVYIDPKYTDIVFYDGDKQISDKDNNATSFRIYNNLGNYMDYTINGNLIGDGLCSLIDTINNDSVRFIGYHWQKKYHPNGIVSEKWNYKNGVEDGLHYTFFDNGRIRSRELYVNGLKEGEYISFFKNGNIKFINKYSKGVLVDDKGLPYNQITTEIDTFDYDYTYNRYLKSEGVLKNGLLDGICYTYYPTGEIETESIYENGSKNGAETTYFKDGEIQRLAFYVNGKLEGNEIRYEGNAGELTGFVDVFNYKKGILDGRQITFRDFNKDSLWWEDYFENGILKEEIRYNDDGTIHEVFSNIIFDENTFTLLRTTYYTEKQSVKYGKQEVDYFYDCLPSWVKKPFELFQIDADRFMNNGGHYYQHGKYQLFDRQNRIRTDGNHTHDSPSGIWKYYNYENEVGFYRTSDYDNPNNVNRYFTLDNKPYSGTVTDYYSDSTKSIGSLKDGFRDGLWIHYEDNGEIINKINFKLGFAVGEGYFYYNDENIYQVINFEDSLTPRRFFSLDGKPYTGKHKSQIDKDANNGADSLVVIIQDSLITEEQYVNSESGQIIKTKNTKTVCPLRIDCASGNEDKRYLLLLILYIKQIDVKSLHVSIFTL